MALNLLLLEAAKSDTSWKRLKALAEHEDREVRRALLQNPALCPIDDQGYVDTHLLWSLAGEFPDEAAEAPAFVLHAFYGDPKPMVDVIRRIVVRTKDPERVRSMFSLFGPLHEGIQWSTANNSMTPPEILRELAEECPLAVASNPNTPPDVLRELVEEWPAAVAGNPKAPPEVLLKLAKQFPQTVACNPNVPSDLLETLAEDWPSLAINNPNMNIHLFRSIAKDWPVLVVDNPNTPTEILRELLHHPQAFVQKRANKHLSARARL